MAPSINNLLIDWETELVRTPIDMLVYCAIRHFVEGLPMCINRRDLVEIFQKYPLVEEAVFNAEVSVMTSFLGIGDVADHQKLNFFNQSDFFRKSGTSNRCRSTFPKRRPSTLILWYDFD
jgi:hypothetical protein